MQKRRRGRRPWQPVAVRGTARLRGRIWNPPLRALYSKVFLRSYCSTPPLKRKIKFLLQTVPFVPTPAAFFSAAGGVVIRRTFSAGAGRQGLESAAQFSTGCIVIGGTVCRAASFIQVVILHTFPGRQRWNPPHSLRRAGLLSAAQFGFWEAFQKCLNRVVIRRTFPSAGLLLSAQFPNCRILAAVVIDGTFLKNSPYNAQPVLLFTAQFVFSGAERLLSGAQFAKILFFAVPPAVGC